MPFASISSAADGVTPAVKTTSTAFLENVVQVAPGGCHTCALDDEGAVWCWGRNITDRRLLDQTYQMAILCNPGGQTVGVETGANLTDYKPRPQTVTGLAGAAVGVGSGYGHTCAIVVVGSYHKVQCWGQASGGGMTAPVGPPTLLPPSPPTRSPARAPAHYFARPPAFVPQNYRGLLGGGSTSATVGVSPITVKLVASTGSGVPVAFKVKAMSVGYYHTCVIIDAFSSSGSTLVTGGIKARPPSHSAAPPPVPNLAGAAAAPRRQLFDPPARPLLAFAVLGTQFD